MISIKVELYRYSLSHSHIFHHFKCLYAYKQLFPILYTSLSTLLQPLSTIFLPQEITEFICISYGWNSMKPFTSAFFHLSYFKYLIIQQHMPSFLFIAV